MITPPLPRKRAVPPRFWLNSLLVLSMLFTLMLGTYVIVTFDPNIS